ncbi:hypothetical protein GCM10020331_064410 [Ectobacillus funiculus]
MWLEEQQTSNGEAIDYFEKNNCCNGGNIMNIRHAVLEDVPGILDIYNDAVRNTTATF